MTAAIASLHGSGATAGDVKPPRAANGRAACVMLAGFACACVRLVAAEPQPAWDNTREAGWSDAFTRVSITSSAGGGVQQAMWHATTKATTQPLIVSLHTWSGDFRQNDPLAEAAVSRGFNYIHPDFRGPNNRPEACGGEFVATDIDDAIDYALTHGRVDRANIHIVGVSGGGNATMFAWMRSRHDVRSFSAWVGISDLEKWYYESVGRGARYAVDLCRVTTGDPARFDPIEARRRSPLFMETPRERRTHSRLFLHVGVHDGYTGSVPITHTIDFYNKVVRDLTPDGTEALVPAAVTEALLRQRTLTGLEAKPKPGDVIYARHFLNRVHLEVFEGGHEMLVGRALDHVPSATILALGDSNGAASDGWVAQLAARRFGDVVINAAVPGNTIGFDNLDNPRLNTLRNLDPVVAQALKATGAIDLIVILLGTNDSKAVFADREAEVGRNLEKLLRAIREHEQLRARPPRVLVVSPPPMGPEERLEAKYLGGPARVERLSVALEAVARRNATDYLDIHGPLKALGPELTKDGVHLLPAVQKRMAEMIHAHLTPSPRATSAKIRRSLSSPEPRITQMP
jgi:lysophospholipase L1-like esterase/pimeloyl-ACP methyl ester carboxylesterase